MARVIGDSTKRKAVEALKTQTYAQVCKQFKCSSSALVRWKREHEAGELGDADDADEIKPAAKPKTLERMFDERVRKAIVLLRQAEEEIERMKNAGALREADTAHLYAGLALRLLQGDNGK